MKSITLGSTGITTPQNAFGALPIQRITAAEAGRLLRRAYEKGMTFFDTARAYSDSEEKIGLAFEDIFRSSRDKIYIATKTAATTPEQLGEELETSLRLLKTDYIDIYQLHCVSRCYRPDDGTGMYEALLKAKESGKICHIGITTHKIGVAEEIIESGLYETLQYPFSYLTSERDTELVKKCSAANMGFIAMKGLSGGLLTNSAACMAFMSQYPVLPIWGIQRESELDEWLSFFDTDISMTDELRAVIEADRSGLLTEFCRGCGYCMPCTAGIIINQCARMSQMIRRAPSANWLSEFWVKEMMKIDSCTNCRACMKKCPYELKIPELLKKNLDDYKKILNGEISV